MIDLAVIACSMLVGDMMTRSGVVVVVVIIAVVVVVVVLLMVVIILFAIVLASTSTVAVGTLTVMSGREDATDGVDFAARLCVCRWGRGRSLLGCRRARARNDRVRRV
jgi:hypothetical protein